MNKLNFLSREVETTPRTNLFLAAGTAMMMLSPISMFASWSRVNQLAFKVVLGANAFQANRPNFISRIVTAFNLITLPYFIGLSLYSAYSDSTYGLRVQMPKIIDTATAIQEKLPSQSQIMEAMETVRSKIPSQAQALEAIRQLSEQIKSKANMTTLTEVYAENKSLILIPAIAAVALFSIGAYRYSRKSRDI